MSAFEELGICPEIIQAIEDDDWLLPTPIQGECIPYILGGQDVCAAAETGSGKTGAFGLPCLQIVHETLRERALTAPVKKNLQLKKGFDLVDKDAFVLVTPDLTEAKCDDQRRWSGIRAHGDIMAGRYQFEIAVLAPGLVRVGVSCAVSALELGTDPRGWGYGGTGKKSFNGKFEDYGLKFGAGDVIGVLVDKDNDTLSFAKNGQHLGVAYQLPPNIGAVKPHVCGKNFHIRIEYDDLKFPDSHYTPLGQISPEHSVTIMASSLDTLSAGKRQPLCLILEPTRDLALQTYQCMKVFSKYLEAPEIRVTLCVGGIDERKPKEELQRGTDIVVGTIPKICHWESRKELNLDKLRFLVLDEADDLIKNDDRNTIPRFKQMALRNTGSRVQTLFFSATLHSDEVKKAIGSLTSNPVWVDLKGRATVPETVHAVIYSFDPAEQLPFPAKCKLTTDGVHSRDNLDSNSAESLSERIKLYKPQIAVYIADKLKMETCMVFCRTNLDCNNFEKFLNDLGGGRGFTGKMEGGKENPYSCVVMAGMRDQNERIQNLQHFKDGDVRFLICTDVAARGIDIRELPYLIMLTIPEETDQWFHRVGRVGRAEHMGLAISIVAERKEKVWYHKCSKKGGIGCTNTKLTNQGGCCIWYDEPTYLTSLESRLTSPLPRIHKVTLAVPGILELGAQTTSKKEEQDKERKLKRLFGGNTEMTNADDAEKRGAMILYGKARNDEMTKESTRRVELVYAAADQLAIMEARLQAAFVM